MDDSGHDIAPELVRAQPVRPGRALERSGEIDIARSIGNRREERFFTLELLKIDIEELRRPFGQSHLHQITAQDGKIALAAIFQVIGLVVRQKVGRQSRKQQKADGVEGGKGEGIPFKLSPYINPEPFAATVRLRQSSLGTERRPRIAAGWSQTHCALRPKAIRGSTTASRRSERRMPKSVSSALTVKSAMTMG